MWLTDETLSYTNWPDGEPQQIVGCAYMDVDGAWRTASCHTKLQGAICKMNTGAYLHGKGGHKGSPELEQTEGAGNFIEAKRFFSEASPSHKWSYNGSCPKSVEDSSWIPFRNHCYAFHMEIMLDQKEARKKCQKGRGLYKAPCELRMGSECLFGDIFQPESRDFRGKGLTFTSYYFSFDCTLSFFSSDLLSSPFLCLRNILQHLA